MATTEKLAGMHLTGRVVAGDVSELIELESEEGVLYTAIRFSDKYKADPVLLQAVSLSLSFMEFPMVTGLVELKAFEQAEGAFIYPSGNTRSLTEVMKFYREQKAKFSKKAALELCFLAGQILQEASETGPLQGVYSHSDLTPDRILIRPDGDVLIVGYGIPSPEMLAWNAGREDKAHTGTALYSPPERFQGVGEDVTSDLYSLACIVAELICHAPLFSGNADAVKKAHLNGEGPTLVNQLKSTLGAPVAEILAYCLHFDPRNRYADGNAFVEAVGTLLQGIAGGEDLADVVKPVHERKAGRTLRNVPTGEAVQARPGVGAPTRGRSIRPPVIPQGEQPSSEGRWGKVSRGRGAEEEEEEVENETEEESSRRRRRRRRTEEEEPKEEVTTSRRGRSRHAKPEEEEEEDLSASRRRRRRTESESDDEQPAEEQESAAARRRRRRGADDDEPEAKAEEPEEEESAASRRRRRRGGDEEPEAKVEEEAPRRRSRRGGDEEPEAKVEEEAPRRRSRRGDDEPEAKVEEESPRRRTRRGSDDSTTRPTTPPRAAAAGSRPSPHLSPGRGSRLGSVRHRHDREASTDADHRRGTKDNIVMSPRGAREPAAEVGRTKDDNIVLGARSMSPTGSASPIMPVAD